MSVRLSFRLSKRAAQHFLLRLFAAVVSTHIILAYGEQYSTFELLVQPEYYQAFPGSFLIAFFLIEVVYRISKYLDRTLATDANILNHVFLQLSFGVIPTAILAYLGAAIYFYYRDVNILKTSYLVYDFPFIVSKIIIINSIYFIYYNYKRQKRALEAGPVAIVPTLAEVMQETPDEELSPEEPTLEISKGLRIKVSQIRYVFHDGRCSYVYATDEPHPLVCALSLLNIEALIGGEQFFRINRQMIVNIDAIEAAKPSDNKRRLVLTLSPAFREKVLVSQLNAPGFKEWENGRIKDQQ